MQYIVTMKNPVSGKLETYDTEAKDRDDLQLGLDFWEHDAGYAIVDVKEG